MFYKIIFLNIQKQPTEVLFQNICKNLFLTEHLRGTTSQYFAKFTGKHLCRESLLLKVSKCKHATLSKTRLRHRCFPVAFVKFSDFTHFFPIAVSVLSILQTYRKENFVKYILILTLLCQSTWNFHNNWVLDVDLKVVTNKDKSNKIYDICHFEEITDKLFQVRSNIDASLAALLEFSQFVCFT